MQPIRLVLSAALAAAFVSCASNKDEYATNDPYGSGDVLPTNPPYQGAASAPSNPVYDSPAAYEDASGSHPSAAVESKLPPAPPKRPAAAANTVRPTTAAGGATHTVVRGDTLGGIARKYNVPMAAIKAANNMKNDTVVLGKTLVIPAR